MAKRDRAAPVEAVEEIPISGSRKRWLALVYLLTFYIPSFLITLVGRKKRKDIQLAWREKVAINILIWLSCGFVLFFMSTGACEISRVAQKC